MANRSEPAIERGIEYDIEHYSVGERPFYLAQGDEKEIFEICFKEQLPLMLKGPTGCGKTRFLRHMAYEVHQDLYKAKPKKKGGDERLPPLVTLPCHEDLVASDLLGRHILDGDKGRFVPGAAYAAVKNGGILYLDEFVEGRPDNMVVIHPLADDRRELDIPAIGKKIVAPDSFMLVVSWNPGDQNVTKEPKPSTRQRFPSIELGYPDPKIEADIVMYEVGEGIERKVAEALVEFAGKTRNIKNLTGASTRLLIHAGKFIKGGLSPERAIEVGIVNALTDKKESYKELNGALRDVVDNFFG